MIYTQLRSFHAVATEGGFTAASRILNIGQPTITIQVKALEEYYGVQLFHRRGRRVELTEAGRALFVVTRRIMVREEEAAALLNAYAGFHVGRLKVGAVGPYHVTEMLTAFNERYPKIKVSVRIGNSQEVQDRLFDYSVDVAVLAHIGDDPHIWTKPYSRHPVVVFVNTDHPWAKRTSISIEELDGQKMVLREIGSMTRRAFEMAIEEAKVHIDPVMEIGSREAVWMAVRRGIGISVVSEIEFIPHPNLRMLKVSNADIFTHAQVACLEERKDSHLIQAFLKVVDELVKIRSVSEEWALSE